MTRYIIETFIKIKTQILTYLDPKGAKFRKTMHGKLK